MRRTTSACAATAAFWCPVVMRPRLSGRRNDVVIKSRTQGSFDPCARFYSGPGSGLRSLSAITNRLQVWDYVWLCCGCLIPQYHVGDAHIAVGPAKSGGGFGQAARIQSGGSESTACLLSGSILLGLQYHSVRCISHADTAIPYFFSIILVPLKGRGFLKSATLITFQVDVINRTQPLGLSITDIIAC
jgi:hypothetical protein